MTCQLACVALLCFALLCFALLCFALLRLLFTLTSFYLPTSGADLVSGVNVTTYIKESSGASKYKYILRIYMTATERIKCLRTGVLQTFWRKPRFTCFSFVRCGVCANFHPSRLTPRVCNAGLVFLNFLFLGWCLPLGTEM